MVDLGEEPGTLWKKKMGHPAVGACREPGNSGTLGCLGQILQSLAKLDGHLPAPPRAAQPSRRRPLSVLSEGPALLNLQEKVN